MSDLRDENAWLEVLNPVKINEGDLLYISSELLMIMWMCKKRKEEFNPNALLDYLMKRVGAEGTILIPTYNFGFCKTGVFDRRESKSEVGYLGNVALERRDYIRTKHPIHSFAVWGKYQNELVNMENSDSFGEGTPFELMIKKGAKEIGIGIDDIGKACTFIHHIEVMAGVPYRFIKRFNGLYTDYDGVTREFCCDYSARDLTIGYRENDEGLWNLMAKSGAALRWIVSEVPVYCIDMRKAYPDLLHEIKNNQMKNIMDFTIDRDYLFSEAYEVCKD